MRKFLIITIPIVALALFVCIMLSGTFLKTSLEHTDDFPMKIESLMEDIKNEDWDSIVTKIDELEGMWNKIIHRIQFGSEREEINDLSKNIARLRGAAQAKDRTSSLVELSEAYHHWKNIGK